MEKNPLGKRDREEEELLTSFENNEWKTVKNIEEEKLSASKTASKTLSKDVRINNLNFGFISL